MEEEGLRLEIEGRLYGRIGPNSEIHVCYIPTKTSESRFIFALLEYELLKIRQLEGSERK